MSSTAETITLSTSDDPPIPIKVSRAALVTHSKVFADMLSVPLKSDNVDNSIPVTESEKDLQLLLKVLEGEDGRDAITKSFSSADWRTLAKLGDKYQCWCIEKLVEAKAW